MLSSWATTTSGRAVEATLAGFTPRRRAFDRSVARTYPETSKILIRLPLSSLGLAAENLLGLLKQANCMQPAVCLLAYHCSNFASSRVLFTLVVFRLSGAPGWIGLDWKEKKEGATSRSAR